MGQKFYADPRSSFAFPNGAIGFRSGSSFDCLGPYAKVKNCPIEGTNKRLTAYATGYADTMFSVPACVKVRGKHIGGFFTLDDGAIVFKPYKRFADRLCLKRYEVRYKTPNSSYVYLHECYATDTAQAVIHCCAKHPRWNCVIVSVTLCDSENQSPTA